MGQATALRNRIQNTLKIVCNDIDLTAVTGIEFYVSQKGFFGCYTPAVLSSHEMAVIIPFNDAKRLNESHAKLQFAFTDENNTPRASSVVNIPVGELLKEAGYDPI